ncbi:MAG: von Willebrand factor type A domain-containing protein [Chitinophagaceae bacterium]
MKTGFFIFLFFIIHSSAWCQQFYLRGEIKDEAGNPLQNVTIMNVRTGYVYKSGSQGSFGIINTQKIDTFNFSLSGYKPERITTNTDNYVSVKLKLSPSSATSVRQNKLSSLTNGMAKDEQRKWFAGDETYASIIENRFVTTSRFPTTGLSLNVDRASYSNIRRFLSLSSIVPPDAVRVEEMLNYFNLNYILPQGNNPFAIQTKLTSCPWNPANQLYYINLSAKKLNLDALPPSNLVFLIDISGSMDMSNRLPLLKSAFKLLVNNLRDKDSVAIVVYGGITSVVLNTTSGAQKDTILKTIDGLTPGGSTPGESGVKLAYSVATNHFIKGGNNRVILATDGDFNVGVKTEDELDDLISRHRQSGIYLTCLGVGMGNYKDSKIQTLARKGNGNFAYLDNFNEAEKVLMKEFTQTLYAVADDAYMSVEFNPDYVKEYRLIGFDNKVGALNDTLAIVEGGEIGSGYSMMGVFEIAPAIDVRTAAARLAGKFAGIHLKYKNPGDTTALFFNYNSVYDFQTFDKVEKFYRFSASVAMFGALLRSSSFARNINWTDLQTLTVASADTNDVLQQEFVSLVAQAKDLYTKKKKKKRNKDADE